MEVARSFDYLGNLLNNEDNNKDDSDFEDLVDSFLKRPIKPNTKFYSLPDRKEWLIRIKEIIPSATSPLYDEKSDKLMIPGTPVLTWKYNTHHSTNIPTKEELLNYSNLTSNGNNADHFEDFSDLMNDWYSSIGLSFYVKDIVSKDEYLIIPLCHIYKNKKFPLKLESVSLTLKEEFSIGVCYTRNLKELPGLCREISLPGILGDDREEIKGTENNKSIKIFKNGFLYLVIKCGARLNSISYYDNGLLTREISSAFGVEDYREYHNGVAHGINRDLTPNINIELSFYDSYLKGAFDIKSKHKNISGFIGDNKYIFPHLISI